jgi:hypothetical protein
MAKHRQTGKNVTSIYGCGLQHTCCGLAPSQRSDWVVGECVPLSLPCRPGGQQEGAPLCAPHQQPPVDTIQQQRRSQVETTAHQNKPVVAQHRHIPQDSRPAFTDATRLLIKHGPRMLCFPESIHSVCTMT